MNRVLLLMEHEANRRLLSQWLGAFYQVSAGPTAQTLSAPFDLGIVDGPTLDRHWEQVLRRKQAERPVLLPFLLVTSRRDVGLATRHLWHSVDDIITRPVEKVELQARLEVLLRARQLSRQNHLILRSAGEGILGVNGTGKVILANPAAETLLSYPPGGLVGVLVAEIRAASPMQGGSQAAPDQSDSMAAAKRSPQAEGSAAQGTGEVSIIKGALIDHTRRVQDAMFRRRDGTLLPVDYVWSEIRDAGKPTGAVIVFQDIRDRKRSEALLVGQRQVLELIAAGAALPDTLHALAILLEDQVPGSSVAILLLDQDRQHLRLAAAPRLPGGHASAISELTIRPELGPFAQAIARREPVVVEDLTAGGSSGEVLRSALRHGLRAYWLAPFFDGSGSVLGLVALYFRSPHAPEEKENRIASVATRLAAIAVERKRMEAGNHQKLQSLMEQMADGVVAIDEEGRIVLINPAARRLLTLPDEVSTGLLGEAGLPEPLTEVLLGMARPERRAAQRVQLTAGGVEIEAFVSPILTEVGYQGAIALLHDVTAAVKFRRLQESFVANVSHELRGPLATVSATLEAIAEGLIPQDEQSRYFRAVLAEMARLRKLSMDVVTLARIDQGEEPIQAEPFDIGPSLRKVREVWAQRFARAEVTLDVEPQSLWVLADPDRVEQVLSNLLENALRFTPKGGVVRVRVEMEQSCARVSVADTGIGIPKEELPFIWERFYKVDKARTRDPDSGSGLGLAIVRQLVERMGGKVAVDSTPGVGSIFRFTVPLAV